MAAMSCQGPLKGARLDHLARCDHETRVSASSEDLQMGQHALWAIDGRIGGPLEKWSSREGDRAPWLKLEWPRPLTVGRVVIHHGGERDGPDFIVRDFDVSVQDGNLWRTVAQVRGNNEQVSTFSFAPVLTSALKLQVLKGDDATSSARIYELEVHAF